MGDHDITSEQILFIGAVVIFFIITIRFCLKKTTSIADYVQGAGRMGLLPISLSLFATNISCVTASMMAEYYQYGIHFLYETIAVFINCIFIVIQSKVLLPFNFISVNQYLILRFGTNIKLFISVVFLISQATYATVICFSTAVQVKNLLNVNFLTSFLFTYFFCFIMAAMGGFEGVVWTEAFQAFIMLASIILMAVFGTITVGGIGRVFTAAFESGRLNTDFSFDPTVRLTFSTAALGLLPNLIAFHSLYSPAMYQRFVSLGQENVKKAALFSGVVTIIFKIIICFLGYVMYAYYQGCDPVKSGQVSRYNQLQPLFVDAISQKWSMLRGIYSIGYICAGISTLTTVINTCGVVAYQDFFEKRFNPKKKTWKAKAIIILVEAAMLLLCFFLFIILESGENITNFIPLYGSPGAVIASTFILAMFVPKANTKGVLTGSAILLPLSLLWAWSCNYATVRGFIKYPVKPMKIDDCPFNVTAPIADIPSLQDSDIFFLLRISVFIHPVIIFILHFGISILASYLLKSSKDEKVDDTLVHPWCRRFIAKYDEVPLQ